MSKETGQAGPKNPQGKYLRGSPILVNAYWHSTGFPPLVGDNSGAGAVGKWAGVAMPRYGSAPSGVSRPAISGSRLPQVDGGRW